MLSLEIWIPTALAIRLFAERYSNLWRAHVRTIPSRISVFLSSSLIFLSLPLLMSISPVVLWLPFSFHHLSLWQRHEALGVGKWLHVQEERPSSPTPNSSNSSISTFSPFDLRDVNLSETSLFVLSLTHGAELPLSQEHFDRCLHL